MTPLQQLEQKIFDKLPELKQLGVGCEMRFKDNDTFTFTCFSIKKGYYRFTDQNATSYGWDENDLKASFDIIGKPPTLVDVLKWAKLPFKTAEETYFSYGLIRERILELWNLNSIYLRDQDEALINFLNDL